MTEPLDAIIERVKARDPLALAEYIEAKTPALLAFIEAPGVRVRNTQ